jgi:hypothetical protein
MEAAEGDIARMEECLSGIKDERPQSGHFPHKLIDVLVIGLTTIRAGWDEYTVTEDFGKAKERFFRTFLELPHGIPDEKTFARVFSWVAPGQVRAGEKSNEITAIEKPPYPKNDSALEGKCSGLLSATISFTTHCSAKLNDVALERYVGIDLGKRSWEMAVITRSRRNGVNCTRC